MSQKPNNPKGGIAGKLNMAGWRKHYVAAMTADEEAWPQREPGSNLGRIFIILLLLHGFLIGAVVLYNVIAPKPPAAVAIRKPNLAKPPATVLKTSGSVAVPKALATTPDTGRPPVPALSASAAPNPELKLIETAIYEVRSGDNVPGIAAALGASAEELIKLNNLDNTELYPGRKLTYPKRAVPPVLKAMPVPLVATNVKMNLDPEALLSTVTHPKENTTPVKLKDKPAVTRADQPPVTKPAQKNDSSGGVKPKAESQSAPPKVAKASSKTEKPTRDPAARRSHIVGPKETLYSVARKYGVKVDALQKFNGIKDPAMLREGTKLAIPSKN